MWKLTTVFKLPLEPLEDCGSVYGHNMVFQSPQSARCTRQLCFQHYCTQQRHTLSIVAILENSPKCISDIYDISCGSHGKITFQMLEILRRANMSSIEATLTASQLRWTGHIIRMNDSRLPKAVFYGELTEGKCLRGGQRLRYKDVVKRNLKATHITVDHWETLAKDRHQWRQAIHTGKSHIEEKIQQKYQHDHNLRHGLPDPSALVIFCVNCGFKSQIGLFSHQRAKHVTDEPLTDVIIGHDGQQRERV